MEQKFLRKVLNLKTWKEISTMYWGLLDYKMTLIYSYKDLKTDTDISFVIQYFLGLKQDTKDV